MRRIAFLCIGLLLCCGIVIAGETNLCSTKVKEGLKGQVGKAGTFITFSFENDQSPTNGQQATWNTGDIVTWEAAGGGGGGDVTKVGTPVDNQVGVWTGDGTLEGDAGFTWNGTSITLDVASLSILAGSNASGVLTLGGVGGANNENLLLDFETNANAISFSSTTGMATLDFQLITSKYDDGAGVDFGNSSDARMGFEGAGAIDSFQFGLVVGANGTSGYFSLMERADRGNANRRPLAFSVDPVLRIYSADEAEALDYLELYHDQTDAIIDWGGGGLILSGDGTGQDELTVPNDSIDDREIDFGTGANQVSASDIPIALGGGSPTVDQIQEYFDNTGSAGFFLGGALSDGGSGLVDVASGSGFIRTTNDDNVELQSFKWSASAGIAVADNTTQYVYVDDSGVISLSTSEFLETPDKILIGVVTDEGAAIESVFKLGVRLEESIGHAGRFMRGVHGIVRNKRVGGLIFGQSGDANRDVTMTAGQLEWGRTSYTMTAFDTSGADTFTTYSANGQEDAVASQWPNDTFDNAGTLTTMANNKWANLFFWLEPNDKIIMVYGRAEFLSQAGAEAEGVPSSSLPSRISETGLLATRFTFQKSANTTTIESAFDTLFANAAVTDHGNLAGLSDDDHAQYILAAGDTYTGTHDLGGATQFEIVNNATYSPGTTAGQIGLDVTITSHNGMLRYYEGATEMIIPAIPNADLTTTDGHVIDYNAAGNKFTMDSPAAGGETNSLEVVTTGIADTEIPIGTGVDTAVYAALSGDATMANDGVVTVADDQHAHTTTTLSGIVNADIGAAAAIEGSKIVDATTSVEGSTELATTAEIDTGTDSSRSMPVDQFVASKRNIRYIAIRLIASDTDVAVDTDIGGDVKVAWSGTILQSDTLKDQLSARTDTAGTTGTMVVDVHLNGTTIMDTNKLDLETTEKDTNLATTQPDLSTTAISAGDILTFDIDAIHTTAAKGLTVYIAIRE